MAYTITRTGDLIEIHLGPQQEKDGVAALRTDIVRLSKGRPRNILVDISGTLGTEHMPPDLDTFFEGLLFRRYAIYGGKPKAALRTKNLLESIPEHPTLKFLHREEDARAWLEKEFDSRVTLA